MTILKILEKLTCLSAAFAFSLVCAANLIENPGFETWATEANLPTTPAWRWGFQKGKEKGFAIFEQSKTVAFSGTASLHVKDDDAGPCNNTISYTLDQRQVKSLLGKRLYFAARVKQVACSGTSCLGISIGLQKAGGKWSGASAGMGSRGAVDWRLLRTSILVTEDVRQIRLSLNCANNFYNVGEAYFDDLIATADRAEVPELELPSPDVLGHADVQLPPANDTPEDAAYRAAYRNQPPQEEDGRVRPEIRNGTWYVNGRPEFYLGVWLYNKTYLDWNEHGNPLKIDHIAYTTPPGKEVFDVMGFNSSQISAAHSRPGEVVRGLPMRPLKRRGKKSSWQEDERDIADYFKRFGDLPLALDFAFGYHGVYPKDLHQVLDQHNGKWHAFIPFCPEHPEGDRYYRDYFLGGTRAALKNGCNVFLYELFNESSYNCQCPWNIQAFAQAMATRYGTIEAANDRWRTSFFDFKDVAAQSGFDQYPGVWRDWCEFSSDRYVAVLEKYKGVIRSADKRKNIYFTEQAAGTPGEHPGMDYRKIAKALDVMALEGGWRYGFKTTYNAKNEMEAVVATSGSRHFFNCDFYQALTKGRKPVVNDEHYCQRLENGIRVPTKKEDLITSLWLEVLHGLSSNYTYCWDKRQWDWKTYAQAKQNVIKPSYKSSSLLNPYNMPPSELVAFKQFQEELAPFKEKLLPFPRVKPATVAVYYSHDTMVQRANLPNPPKKGIKHESTTSTWYTTLLHAQFPVKVVFDEDLADLGPEIKALVFPDTQCASDETLRLARAYAVKGGLVIADDRAFAYDDYLKKRAEVDLPFLRAVDGAAAVQILLEKQVPRYVVVTPIDDPAQPLQAVDVQICDRGDFKLVLLADMGDAKARRVRLQLQLPNDHGRSVVSNIVTKAVLANGTQETWSASDLANGLELELPVQERVVLVLSER